MSNRDQYCELAAFQDEAQGAIRALVITRESVPALVDHACRGDKLAESLLTFLHKTVADIRGDLSDAMACCGCGKHLVHAKYTVGVVIPDTKDPARGMVFPICADCGFDHQSIHVALQAALRYTWPSLRDGGRA